MLFSKSLNDAEKVTLNDAHKYHPKSWTRTRALCILLSDREYEIKEIADICNVCRQTVSTCIHDWEKFGIVGLIDKHRSGRPIKIKPVPESEVIKKIKESPRSVKNVLEYISKEYKINLSLSTLRNFFKSVGMRWKRTRRSLKKKRNQEEFDNSKNLINQLVTLYKANEIGLSYFDCSGFSLTPSVPYAWQNKNECIEIPSAKSTSFNVLGFMDRKCNLDSYVFTGSITSDVVISCFDEFSYKIDKPTVVLVDNAPVHTSGKFDRKTVEWCKRGLIVVPISRYSPELNIIEILWRKIKYEWMPFSAYDTLESLYAALCDILSQVGTKFTINFC